jgi:hypothetical protein
MKSDVIIIDNHGNGFDKSLDETRKVAAYEDLTHKESLCLQLCAEEMLSLARSITGEMKASFWIETESRTFNLHLTTKTVMDKEKRSLLLGAATSGKNEAAVSFLGALRDAFEHAMAADVSHSNDLPADLLDDLPNHVIECLDPEWDKYEQSTLKRLADTIRIGIRGDNVDMTVTRKFA